MKKLIYYALALSAGIFATSCMQEDIDPVNDAGIVTFEVAIPELATKSYDAEGKNVNDLVYAVYSTEKDNLEEAQKDSDLKFFYAVNETTGASFDANGKSIVSLELLNDQNYLILFWAQSDDAWIKAQGGDINLFDVTYPTPMSANNELLEAFSGVSFIKNVKGARKETVNLTRPFAQINIATTMPEAFIATLSQSEMSVVRAAKSFNVATQLASEDAQTVSFTAANVPVADFKTGYTYAGANYIFANGNVNVTYKIYTSHGNVENTVPAVPVAKNYRTNIIGNLLTSNIDYTVELDAEWGTPDAGETFIVNTDEELAAAVKSDAEIVEIILGADLNISAANAAALGGAKTKKITISGNKHLSRTPAEYYTLTINTTYNNVVKAVNPESELILTDLNLTSNKASGTWDVYDILFKNNVTLRNINALQSIALDDTVQNAEFENLTITESHDYYALWICAAEMNVKWDGGVVNCPNGRGIKIDDEYLENPGHTTLTINDVAFNTKKKAAIVTKSAAEVTVNTTDIDITNTVDPINEVWVDEAAAANYDKVTVNETTDKALEGSGDVPVVVSTPQELQAAINAAKEGKNLIYFKNVIISDTNITVLQKVGVNIIIDGNDQEFDGTFVLEGGSQGNSTETLTFKNIKFKHEKTGTFYFIDANSAEVGKRYVHNVTVDNCTFTGSADAAALRFRQAYNMTVSNTSVVSGHSLLQAYGTTGITIDKVNVEAGRGVSLGSSTDVEIKNSEFTVNSYGVRGNGDGNQYDINVTVTNSTINAKQPIVIRNVTDADHTYALALDNANLQTEEDYHVVFTNGADDAEYVKPTGLYELTGADAYNVFPAPFPVATWDEFTEALADGEDWIKLTADISTSASYTLTKDLKLELNDKAFAIDNASACLNIGDKNNTTKPNVTIKGGNLNCMVYGLSGNVTIQDVVFGGTVSYVSAYQGVVSTKHANLLMENCKMTNVKKSGSTKPRSICTEGRSSGYLILRNCNFKNSNLDRPYINPLNGNTTFELIDCALYGAASNIDLGASYSWTNMNLKGCSGGFTFTISRASTSLTDEEMAVYKAIKKNNSGSMRFIFSDGEKNNL